MNEGELHQENFSIATPIRLYWRELLLTGVEPFSVFYRERQNINEVNKKPALKRVGDTESLTLSRVLSKLLCMMCPLNFCFRSAESDVGSKDLALRFGIEIYTALTCEY